MGRINGGKGCSSCSSAAAALQCLGPFSIANLLTDLGFCNKRAPLSMIWLSRLWHVSFVCPPAFFASPRGRWLMSLSTEVVFLTLYMITVGRFERRQDTTRFALLVFSFAELLESMQQLYGVVREDGVTLVNAVRMRPTLVRGWG